MPNLDWPIIGILALLIVLGFGLRVTQLGAIGFAEDEMNKLDAIHAYEREERRGGGRSFSAGKSGGIVTGSLELHGCVYG